MCKGGWKCYLSWRMRKVALLWTHMTMLKSCKQCMQRSLMLLFR